MKVKEILFDTLQEVCKTYKEGVTASELATKLEMKRNLVSQYLNELVRDKMVIKSSSRPIYFSIPEKSEFETTPKENLKCDAFQAFVGADGCMIHEIEQCRSAVQYPNQGLPILLNGNSGVGKSFLAELIYQYAKDSEVIHSNAPFITLNCADYANNPELLTAMLFGYCKGAYTGADKDNDGLVAQADQGYLFLDEVHRLNSESQEKLFLLMDKNEYRRMGETTNTRTARVRLIFATTEEPSKVLIHTLQRRIPMVIHIPSLQERPIKEKLELIQLFYLKESEIFQKPIKVSAQAVNLLLSLKTDGNIGSLQNSIRYSCAYSFRANDQKESIYIDIHAFPAENKLSLIDMKEYVKEDFLIHKDMLPTYASHVGNVHDMKALLVEFNSNYNDKKQEFSHIGTLQKMLYRVCDALHIKEINSIHSHLIQVVIENFEKGYGIHLPMDTSHMLCAVVEGYQSLDDYTMDDIKSFQEAMDKLESYQFKTYALAEKLIQALNSTLGTTLKEAIRFYITLYIMLSNHNAKAKCYNALIMAHGNSTASSIASVANELLGEYIFESFDMPIDISFDMFITVLKKYLQRINKNYPTIILVDMGSLLDIDKHMEVDEYQEIGILDNVSTTIALETGNRLKQGEHISSILPSLCDHVHVKYRYIQPKKRKKAIVCICISGIGTAEKIKGIIKDFVQDDCELLTYDYMSVVKEGKGNHLFKEYDVQCLIGTSDINVEGIDSININHLMHNGDEKDIRIFIDKVIRGGDEINLEQAQQKIVKAFSLENLINRLVFLNPQTIIDDVEKIIFDTEVFLHIKFDTDTRMMLFLHIAVLIERTLLKDCDEEIYQDEAWIIRNDNKISLISSTFSEVERKFNIQIPKAEIITILYMIDLKQK